MRRVEGLSAGAGSQARAYKDDTGLKLSAEIKGTVIVVGRHGVSFGPLSGKGEEVFLLGVKA
jgi:hypothetical protein